MLMYATGSNIRNAPSAIRALPAQTITQIRSSHTITSLNDVAVGLLENALDAQATKIQITIDARRGACTIEDNGVGILPIEFRDGGGLGRMHHTSKRSGGNTPCEVHGDTGTFLASVAALSLVTITSRHIEHYSHNTLAIHRTKPIVRMTPAPLLHHIHGTTHGTRVTVKDLFGGMPVRVKQRAQAVDDQHESERSWQTIKKGIVGLLLPCKRPVTVKVYDIGDSTRSLSVSCNKALSSHLLSEENVNALMDRKAAFDPSGVLSILSQTGYSLPEYRNSWIPAYASTDSLSVSGLICLEPAPTRSAQFISIGLRPCSDETSHHDLFEAVNRTFSDSSFGCNEDDVEPDEKKRKRRMSDRRHKYDGPTERQRRGGGRGLDRWPRFYLHIEPMDRLPARDVQKGYTGSGMQEVVNVLQALAVRWLEANHFRPRNRTRAKQRLHEGHARTTALLSGTPPTPSFRADDTGPTSNRAPDLRAVSQPLEASKTGRRVQSPFADWSRIKSGRSDQYQDLWKCKSTVVDQENTAQSQNPVINIRALSVGELGADYSASTLRKAALETTISQHEPVPIMAKDGNHEHPDEDDLIEWLDPKTNKRLRINARTGMVVPDTHVGALGGSMTSSKPAPADSNLSSAGRPLYLSRRQTAPVTTTSPWLTNLLQGWDNPVFANQTEQTIPVATHDYGEMDHACGNHQIDQAFLQASLGSSKRLSKDDLLHTEVISQVDHKFILLKLSSDNREGDDLLALVDQHAASERCILEELLAELCTANGDPHRLRSDAGLTSQIRTYNLESPLRFQVTKAEGTMFETHAAYFARWGILYNSRKMQTIKDSNEMRLDVLTLPPGIAERCKAEPKHLIELLRTEIHALAEGARTRVDRAMESQNDAGSSVCWLKQIGSCPSGIIKMLNSRACRSAIMFNDKLSNMECRELIQKLATCAFPFMCAHGRVSMVPLVSLGDGDGGILGSSVFERGRAKAKERSFADSFKQWRMKAEA